VIEIEIVLVLYHNRNTVASNQSPFFLIVVFHDFMMIFFPVFLSVFFFCVHIYDILSLLKFDFVETISIKKKESLILAIAVVVRP